MKKTWLITSIAFWGLAVFCLLNKDEIGFWNCLVIHTVYLAVHDIINERR